MNIRYILGAILSNTKLRDLALIVVMLFFHRNPIKPRIGESAVEGFFKDPQDGKIKKGNKWLKFPSSISITDILKKPTVDKNEDNQSVESGLSFKEKTKDSTKTSTTTPSNQKTGDAVVFG